MEYENSAEIWKKDLCTVLIFHFLGSDIPFGVYQSQKNRDEYTVVSETHKAKLLVIDM